MLKSFLFFLLLVSVSVCPAQAGAAEGAPSSPFKTGEYRVCRGTEEACLQGKGELGEVTVRFEKDRNGLFTGKGEQGGFTWEERDGSLLLTSYDDAWKPITLEKAAEGSLLRESSGVFYVLTEDEDTIFRTGMYSLCPENTEASCRQAETEFLRSYYGQENTTADYLILGEEGSGASMCSKIGEKGCVELLVWRRAGAPGELEIVKPSGEVLLRLSEDRNMLVDKKSGARYLRVMSESMLDRSF